MKQLTRTFLLAWALCLSCLGVTAHAAPSASEYVLGVGDVIRVSVFQNPDLQLDTRVSEAGTVSYPLVGTVRIGGLSVSQAEKQIADALRSGNFVKQPQVTIFVAQVRGNQASVLGQVLKPGRYPLETTDIHLTELLAIAGGITPGSGSDIAVVTGTRNGKPMRVEVDLPVIFASANRDNDMLMQHGDVVWVDRVPVVYVYGEVQRPGQFALARNMTVQQALAAAGGLTMRGTEKGLRINRRGADGKIRVVQPNLYDELKNGDVIQIRESLF